MCEQMIKTSDGTEIVRKMTAPEAARLIQSLLGGHEHWCVLLFCEEGANLCDDIAKRYFQGPQAPLIILLSLCGPSFFPKVGLVFFPIACVTADQIKVLMAEHANIASQKSIEEAELSDILAPCYIENYQLGSDLAAFLKLTYLQPQMADLISKPIVH